MFLPCPDSRVWSISAPGGVSVHLCGKGIIQTELWQQGGFCLAPSNLLKSAHEPGSTVLVKASRRFGFGKVSVVTRADY